MSRYLLLDRVFSRHHFEYQDDLSDEVVLSQTKQKCGQTSVHCTTTSVLSAQGGFFIHVQTDGHWYQKHFMSRYLLLDRVFSHHQFEYQDDLRDEVVLSQTKQKCGQTSVHCTTTSVCSRWIFIHVILMAIGIKNILFGDHI